MMTASIFLDGCSGRRRPSKTRKTVGSRVTRYDNTTRGTARQNPCSAGKDTENGCTESETMAALDRARAMMDAYAVTESELALTKEEKAILRREPPGTKDPHR